MIQKTANLLRKSLEKMLLENVKIYYLNLFSVKHVLCVPELSYHNLFLICEKNFQTKGAILNLSFQY